MYHELCVVFHTRQAAQVTLGWRAFVDTELEGGKRLLAIWDGLRDKLIGMPIE